MIHFTLYSRTYCHLCDDMLEQLRIYQSEFEFEIEVVDVDQSDDLVAQYDELVPVLLGRSAEGESAQICHYFLDHEQLKRFLHASS